MPRTWVKRTLGEVAHLTIGRTPPRDQRRYWTNDLSNPFCTIADLSSQVVTPSREGVTDIAISEGKAKLAVKGTLLMSFKLTLGRLGFAGQDLYPNEAIVSIVPRTADVLDLYLFYLLGFQDLSAGSGRAVKGATLNSKSLAEIPLLLPPLEEQRRIVDLMSSVDAYIAALEQQSDTAREARGALVLELLTSDSDDWAEVKLDDIAELVPGKYVAKSEYVEDGSFFIYGSNSVMGKYSKPLIEAPHTVMAAIGAYAGAVRFSAEPSWVNNNAFGLVTGSRIEPRFFYYWLENILDLTSVVAGTGQPYVQRPLLKSAKICLPSLQDQRRIVEIVSSVDEMIQSTEQAAAHAKTLRSGLLSDLLSGSHEIPETYDRLLGAA